ncbi:MAG: glycosyltransferase family 4 protein [Thermoproteota archaeon]
MSNTLSILMLPPADMSYHGGSVIHTTHLAQELSKLGHEVHLIYRKGSVKGVISHKVNVRINHPVVFIKATHNSHAYEPASVEDLADGIRLYVKKSLEIAKIKKIDIIHTQHLGFNFLAGIQIKWLVGGALIATSHGIEVDLIQNPNYHPQTAFDVNLARRLVQTCVYADHIISVSSFITKKFHEKFTIPYDKISTIPNGVDTNMFNPRVNGNKVRSRYRISTTDKLIMFAGRLAYEKGLDTLIEAVSIVRKSISNIKLMLVGSADPPEMKERLATLAKEKGIGDVTVFTDFIPHDKMPYYYAAADVCALPSRAEAFGISALEAMATGKPVVASEVGGIPEVVKNGLTGKLVKPESPKELADALLELLSDEQKIRKIGYNARRVAENEFSWEVIAKKTEEIYRKTLDKT